MNWDAIGAVAELVGALGVIASLIYLAAQIRQSTRSSRATTFQTVCSDLSHIYRALASDSELARIYRLGLLELETLDQGETLRFTAFLTWGFKSYENMFVQYHQGAVDNQTWESWRRSMLTILELPGAARFWELRGGVFREDFQHLVKQLAPSDFPPAGSGNPFRTANQTPSPSISKDVP